MPRRDDDDLELMPGLAVDREDSVTRNNIRSGDARAKQGAAQATAAPQSGGNTATWILGVLLVLVLGVCGWLGLEMVYLQKQFNEAQGELDWARNRVEALGRQVKLTGSSMTESDDEFGKKFKFYDSEIRKLWDVSNKRNKKAIAANKKQLGSLSGQIKKSTASQSSQLKAVTSKQAANDKSVQQLKSENTALNAQIEDQSEQLLLVRGELEVALARLNEMPANLGKRVNSHDEAIQSFDAFRKQMISNLNQLKSQVSQLQSGAGTP